MSKIILELWAACSASFIGLWFLYIAYLAKEKPKRRCLRLWLGITALALALENSIDALSPWEWQLLRNSALYLKVVCITICVLYIVKSIKERYHN